MKNLIKIIAIIFLALAIFLDASAGIKGLDTIEGSDNITDNSIFINSTGTLEDNIGDAGFSILTTIKYILSGLLVMFLVYVGIQMILSMGSDEDKLNTSKKQLRYTLIGLVFINIPGSIYNIFLANKSKIDGSINGTWSSELSRANENILINTKLFEQTVSGGIIMFVKSAIFAVAIFIIVIAGIKIMTARGKEEDMTEAKDKIIWSIAGLIFVGFIEAWQSFVYSGNVSYGAGIFATIEELVLFFAGPVAIFFLTLAGYYYITSNGDEEKVKKAKSIIINTLIATLILLASYAFLRDLITLKV